MTYGDIQTSVRSFWFTNYRSSQHLTLLCLALALHLVATVGARIASALRIVILRMRIGLSVTLMTSKAPFIATQLNSTRRRVELS